MALQRIDFRSTAQGGDSPTGALVKLDNNVVYLDQYKLDKAGGSITGNLAIGTSSGPSGALDVRTGAGAYILRTLVFGSSTESVIDAASNDNTAWGQFGVSGTSFSFYSRNGDGRLLARVSSGAMSVDSVNAANNAFAKMAFTATGYVFSGGDIKVNGSLTATGTVSWSDERLKTDIGDVPVTRGMALALAQHFQEWRLLSNGYHDFGVTAQNAQPICARWVRPEIYTPAPVYRPGTTELADVQPEPVERFTVDKPGMALEASMDNALGIEELRQALAAALARIEALEAR